MAQTSVLPNPEIPRIRVVLADQPSVSRDGLKALLTSQADIDVIAGTSDRNSVLALAAMYRPDIILFEADGKGVALPVLRDLRQLNLPTRIILLTNIEDPEQLTQAVREGVCGIVPKKSPADVFFDCIRRVNAGELWLDRAITTHIVEQLTHRPIPVPRNAGLTTKTVSLSRRELAISGMIARGYRNREIADELFISEQTVKNHVHSIFQKLGVRDRLEVALYAIYHRLCD
jgi:two-component system, NarL family, nitrate/nitrite response regulator NarL